MPDRQDMALDFGEVSSLVGDVGEWLGFGRLLPMRTVMVFDESGYLVLGTWARRDDPLTQQKMDASMKEGAITISSHPTRDEFLASLKKRSRSDHSTTVPIPRRTVVEIDFPMGVCAPCSEMSAIVEKAVATRDDVQWMRVGLSSEDISVEREQSAQGR